jgi:hypothetical protein
LLKTILTKYFSNREKR